MIKKINFSKYQEVKTSYWQYDYGQKIEIILSEPISGLQIHWGKNNHDIVETTEINESNQAIVPDSLLSGTGDFFGFLYIDTLSFGMTLYKLKVKLKLRVGLEEKITAD